MARPFMTMDIECKISKISIYSALSHGTYTTLKAYTDVNYIFHKVIFSLRLDFNSTLKRKTKKKIKKT